MTKISFLAGALLVPLAGCATKTPAIAQTQTAPEKLAPLQIAAQNDVRPWNGTVQTVPYHWRMANEGGGGNTTGFAISPLDSNVMFVQSGDTGGYRWNAAEKRWIQFSDWNPDVRSGYLTGLAVSPRDPKVVFYAAGNGEGGNVYRSADGGATWKIVGIQKSDGKAPQIKGGEDASTAGPRLTVDPNNPNVVYYAARYDGLFRSLDATQKPLVHVPSLTARGAVARVRDGKEVFDNFDRQGGLTWVLADPTGGTVQVEGTTVSKILYVSVAGNWQGLQPQNDGGVYKSEDGGQSWRRIEGTTRSSRGSISRNGTLIYSSEGKIWRVRRGENSATDLKAPVSDKGGYYAVSVFAGDENNIAAIRYGIAPREYSVAENNRIVHTLDGGQTWRELKNVRYEGAAAWWNWFGSWTHWMLHDPQNPNVVWMGDWANPWKTEDITAQNPVFTEVNRGKSGSYVNGIATPPHVAGQSIAPVLTTGADWAGFRMVSLRKPPRTHLTQSYGRFNGFADGTSVAFSESDPNFVAAVGGWDHGQNGGGGASTDGGRTWIPFEGKGLNWPGFGRDPKLGRIAVGATKGANGFPILVWAPRFQPPRFSLDFGKTWTQSQGAPSGVVPSEWDSWQPLAACPVDGQTFYIFNNNENKNGGFGEIFRTTNGAKTWQRMGGIKYGWSERRMAWYHLRTVPGRAGELWVSVHDQWDGDKTGGLYRSTDAGATWQKVVGFSAVESFAFGAPAPGKSAPSMLVAGRLNGKHAIFHSDDALEKSADLSDSSWKMVWEHQPQGGPFADSLAVLRGMRMVGADRQQYGRFYSGSVGTGRSMYYGDPDAALQSAPKAPLNLEGRASYGEVRLYWSDPLGAQTYNLYRSTSAGQNGQIIAANLEDSGFLDKDFAPETRYFYRVEAVNSKGKSAMTAPVSFVPYFKITPKRAFGTAGLNAETFDKAVDGKPNTAFDAAQSSGGFVGVELERETTISRVRYTPRQWQGKRMVGGKFQVANAENGPWSDIYTVKTEPPTGPMTEADLEPVKGRFFRYLGPDKGHSNIGEFELYSGGN